jgi:hypothetical protein
MKKQILMGLTATMLLSCGENSKTGDALRQAGTAIKEDASTMAKNAEDKAKEAIAKFPAEREAFLNKAKSQKDSLDNKIKQIQKDYKSGNLSADAKVKLAKLEADRKVLGSNIEKASHTSAEAWGELKTGFEKAGADVSTGVQKAKEKIQH